MTRNIEPNGLCDGGCLPRSHIIPQAEPPIVMHRSDRHVKESDQQAPFAVPGRQETSRSGMKKSYRTPRMLLVAMSGDPENTETPTAARHEFKPALLFCTGP